jgi:hypothetical protein
MIAMKDCAWLPPNTTLELSSARNLLLLLWRVAFIRLVEYVFMTDHQLAVDLVMGRAVLI